MTSGCVHVDVNICFMPRAIMFETAFSPPFKKKEKSCLNGWKVNTRNMACVSGGYLQKTMMAATRFHVHG